MKSLCLCLLGALVWVARAQEPAPLKLVGTIPLPEVKGRCDHFALDVQRQRLFVAAPANNTVEVLDLKAGKRHRPLTGVSQPRGLLFLPKPNLLFVAGGGDGRLRIFECADFRMIKTLGALPNADHLRYDTRANRVYIGFGDGALGVVDAFAGVHTSSIHLQGHAEAFQLEADGDRIFVNVPSAQHVAVVDRHTKEVAETWPLPNFNDNFPMALDEANHRLFIGCRNPPRLVILDTAGGKAVTDLPISSDADDLFYDPKRKRIYASCGEGFVDVIEQSGADSYKALAKVRTAPGASTSIFSPELNRLYLAVPQGESQRAEIRVFEPQQ